VGKEGRRNVSTKIQGSAIKFSERKNYRQLQEDSEGGARVSAGGWGGITRKSRQKRDWVNIRSGRDERGDTLGEWDVPALSFLTRTLGKAQGI